MKWKKIFSPTNISVVGLVIALLGWFKISPSSFKSVIAWLLEAKIPDIIVITAIIVIFLLLFLRKPKVIKGSESSDMAGLEVDVQGMKQKISNMENDMVSRSSVSIIEESLIKVYKETHDRINSIERALLEKKANGEEEGEDIEVGVHHLYILYSLASEASSALGITSLHALLEKKFEGKSMFELQLILQDLMDLSYIVEVAVGSMGEIGYEITGEGKRYLKVIRREAQQKRSRPKSKQLRGDK